MKSSIEISNHIYYEKYAKEIESFLAHYKLFNINKNMLFYQITNNKNRSLISFLQKERCCLINYTKQAEFNFFNYYKVIIVGFYYNQDIITLVNKNFININKAKNKELNYVLEITNIQTNEIKTIICPITYIGKGNNINWKKEKLK